MKNLQRVLAALLMVACFVTAFGDSKSAAAVMKAAQEQAKRENKKVMVTFDASWCGWCKKLEAFIADKDMNKILTNNFVIVKLDVLESPDKKALENAGGEALMASWNGKDAGLPFTVITDATGKMLVNSNEKDGKTGNIGYPAAANEIAHFMDMLKKTAPRMTDAERTQLKDWLVAHAPKQ